MTLSQGSNRFLLVNPAFTPRRLEEPSLYRPASDELYELNEEAWRFILACAGGQVREEEQESFAGDTREFVQYCLQEGILYWSAAPGRLEFPRGEAGRPSLRYLEVQLTTRCNLRCRHCFLPDGADQQRELPFDLLREVLREFADQQGLCLLLSGGEPLLYSRFWELNELLPQLGLRSVLLTNATLLRPAEVRRLNVDEVQVSLDGLEEAHDFVRGPGSFRRASRAVEALQEAGVRVSVATMIFRSNLADFPRLQELLAAWNIEEWNVDFPATEGRLRDNPDLLASPREAAPYLDYATASGHYSSASGLACGAHLAALTAQGRLSRCGFFSEGPALAEVGLRRAWEVLPRQRLDQLTCRECPAVESCRGGCRYRAALAGDPCGPDPVQCCRFGQLAG